MGKVYECSKYSAHDMVIVDSFDFQSIYIYIHISMPQQMDDVEQYLIVKIDIIQFFIIVNIGSIYLFLFF